MLMIEIEKTVYYTYELTEKEESEIHKIISENKNGEFTYGTSEQNIAKAFEILEWEIGTDAFQDAGTAETEIVTNGYRYSGFNECSADEWIMEGA